MNKCSPETTLAVYKCNLVRDYGIKVRGRFNIFSMYTV